MKFLKEVFKAVREMVYIGLIAISANLMYDSFLASQYVDKPVFDFYTRDNAEHLI